MQHRKLGAKEGDTIVRKIGMVRFILVVLRAEVGKLTFHRTSSYRNVVMKVLSNVVLLRTCQRPRVRVLHLGLDYICCPFSKSLPESKIETRKGYKSEGWEGIFFEGGKSCGNNLFSA